MIQIEQSVYGEHGIRTWGHRMVGPDKTTKLWWPPKHLFDVTTSKICRQFPFQLNHLSRPELLNKSLKLSPKCRREMVKDKSAAARVCPS